MALELPRRKFLLGLTGLFCAPAIIKVAPLMRIKPIPRQVLMLMGWDEYGQRVTERISGAHIAKMRFDWVTEYAEMPAQWDRVFA